MFSPLSSLNPKAVTKIQEIHFKFFQLRNNKISAVFKVSANRISCFIIVEFKYENILLQMYTEPCLLVWLRGALDNAFLGKNTSD